MFFCSEYHGNSSKRTDQLCKVREIFQSYIAAWGEDIIGILQNPLIGMLETGFLRTCHWMSADETVCHSQFIYLLMDDPFHTSYVCDDAARLTDFF